MLRLVNQQVHVLHACMHTYIHNSHTSPRAACRLNCLPERPKNSSPLGSLQSPCPIFKQSCLDSPRIKTSGKLQAQTSTSFSLKQNMSLCVRTHPKTRTPLKPSQTPCRSEHASHRLRPSGGQGLAETRSVHRSLAPPASSWLKCLGTGFHGSLPEQRE